MAEVCATCGLPDELCVCEDISKDGQQVNIQIDERRFGKQMTIVDGFDAGTVDVEALASDLKSQLACGGTVHDDTIELQGDHRDRIDEILAEHGFQTDA
jgi:translation initiation factor 1